MSDPNDLEGLTHVGGPVAGIIGVAVATVSKYFIGQATKEMSADLKELVKLNVQQEVKLGSIETRIGILEKVSERDAQKHDTALREITLLRAEVKALHDRVDDVEAALGAKK